MIPADCNRQVDALMAFKKSCCNTLKFSSKNIPVALIQVGTTSNVSDRLTRNNNVIFIQGGDNYRLLDRSCVADGQKFSRQESRHLFYHGLLPDAQHLSGTSDLTKYLHRYIVILIF